VHHHPAVKYSEGENTHMDHHLRAESPPIPCGANGRACASKNLSSASRARGSKI
jgi:hypothetical protein